SLISQTRTPNSTGFSTPYRFNAKELDSESGLYYYGARYYDPKVSAWLSVDALSDKFPSWSPYNFSLNNPINLVDPDGNAPGDPPRFGGSFGFTLSSGGHMSASIGVGVSYQTPNFMGAAKISASAYNFGLGTSHGSTGMRGLQMDLVGSLSATGGWGSANGLTLNTFSNNARSGVQNTFKNSLTLGSNFVFNSNGRNQRVGYVGLRSGDVQAGVYNDFFPVLGDRDDRFWTGGGSLQFSTGATSSLTMGTDVFTGERLGKNPLTGGWLLNGSNPAGGKFGTYAQTPGQQLLNNGQTYFRVENGMLMGIGSVGGQNHMYSQDAIHNTLGHPLFLSTALGL
ncbi:RHS repeat-associated core domain-containing protein, partial [Schleiferia thermophila]